MAVSILKAYLKIPVIPGKQLVGDVQLDEQGCRRPGHRDSPSKTLHINDTPHGVGTDGFLDIPIVHLKGDGFAEIGVSVYLINHGIVGVDVFPEPFF